MEKKTILFFACLVATPHLTANKIISFFMRPYPYLSGIEKKLDLKSAIKKSKKLKIPGKIAKYTIRSISGTNSPSGIFSTYSGQLTASDTSGQITFARRQTKAKVKLLITNKIDPILMDQQTIHHWQLELNAPAEMYLIEQKDDEKTSTEFWDVKKIPLPESKRIPVSTIIVFAKPSHIFVPEGITITEPSSQLILPDIYVKKNVEKLTNSLYILDLKRFFSPVKQMYQSKEKEFSVLVY